MQLELARHSRRLQARHPIIIEELLALSEGGNPRGAESLRVVLEVIAAYQLGVPVFEEPVT